MVGLEGVLDTNVTRRGYFRVNGLQGKFIKAGMTHTHTHTQGWTDYRTNGLGLRLSENIAITMTSAFNVIVRLDSKVIMIKIMITIYTEMLHHDSHTHTHTRTTSL